jgi:hypothetical protein
VALSGSGPDTTVDIDIVHEIAKAKCNVYNSAKDVNTGGPGTHAW